MNEPYQNRISGFIEDVRPVYSRRAMNHMMDALAAWMDLSLRYQSRYLKCENRYYYLAAAFAVSFWANFLLLLLLVIRR
jgi:hypothetical protein